MSEKTIADRTTAGTPEQTGGVQTRTIDVRTPSKDYQVLVGAGVIDELGPLTHAALPKAQKAQIIADSNVAPLYGDTVAASLEEAGLSCSMQVFEAGEQAKKLSTLSDLLEGLAESELSRDDVVVALGGGVAGDMAGLAAALYLRGCAVVQVPTSLLAMVDSSVGGKTAVDLAAGKNLAGAFFQPSLVVADIDCLDTLSPQQFTDSVGEVIKYGVIADPQLFDQLEAHPLSVDSVDPDQLASVIARCIEIKRDVVQKDEREGGIRQILNFGHTIGHAIEAASNFQLGHGSSVAAGMCAIARASAARGWCDQEVAERIVALVAAHGLPTDTATDHQELLSYASHDKKRHGSTVNVVVPTAIGTVEVRKVGFTELLDLIDLGCRVA